MNLLTALPLLAAAGILTFATPSSWSSVPGASIDAALAAPQGGGPGCSVHSLRGNHGFHYDGVILGVGPVASTGPIFFDGHGNLSASYTTTINGLTFRGSFLGTYVVAPNGSGSVTLVLPTFGAVAAMTS